MEKFRKNLLVTLAILSCGISLTSCNNTNNNNPKDEEEIPEVEEKLSISFKDSEKNMVLGDVSKLIVTNSKGLKNVDITWSSTDTNIVKVDQTGKVEAILEGEAAVIAKCGDSVASCKIVVSSSYYLPTLEFNNYLNDNETVQVNGDINLSASILFNSKKFSDATIEYEVTNENAGTVDENGIFHAKNILNEETDVLLKAKWRNFDNPSLNKKIHIKVVSTGSITLNGGLLKSINLFTVDQVLDQTYETSVTIETIECSYNGQMKNVKSVQIAPTIGSDCVSLSQNAAGEYVISAVKEGNATLLVSFEKDNSEEYTKEFDIKVSLPIYRMENPVHYFSILDGKFYDENEDEFKSLETLFPVGEKVISKATAEDQDLTVDSGAINGLNVGSATSMKTVNLTVYNHLIGVNVDVEAYEKVMTDTNDFTLIFSGKSSSDTNKGYFVLVKDLTTKKDVEVPSGKVACNFGGVFDGLGHKVTLKIRHYKAIDEFGLFGSNFSGTIRNVAFYDCESDSQGGGFLGSAAVAGSLMQDVYLNVYVNKTNNNKQFGGFRTMYGPLNVNRVVIYSPTIMDSSKGNGVLGVHKLGDKSSDLYVVSQNNIGINVDGANVYKTYANEAEKQADPNFASVTNPFVLTCCQKTVSFDILAARGNSYTAFGSDIWDCSSGVPVFKGLNYYH